MEQGRSSSSNKNVEEEEEQKKVVMVAIDGSDFGERALRWTLEKLGKSIADAKLIVYTVQPVPDYTYLLDFPFDPDTTELRPDTLDPDNDFFSKQQAMEHVKFIEERQKKAALRLLENAVAVCKTYGIDAEGMSEVGDPKEAICRAVVKYNVQLLVIGSHGRGAFKRAFLGSVSHYCVHHAECPVLVVRRDSN